MLHGRLHVSDEMIPWNEGNVKVFDGAMVQGVDVDGDAPFSGVPPGYAHGVDATDAAEQMLGRVRPKCVDAEELAPSDEVEVLCGSVDLRMPTFLGSHRGAAVDGTNDAWYLDRELDTSAMAAARMRNFFFCAVPCGMKEVHSVTTHLRFRSVVLFPLSTEPALPLPSFEPPLNIHNAAKKAHDGSGTQCTVPCGLGELEPNHNLIWIARGLL